MKKHLLAEVFIRNWIKYKIWPTIGSGRRRWVYEQVMLVVLSMLSFANNYTLHGERRAFSYVSQFPLEVFSWKIMSLIFHACATHIAHFVPIGRLINGTLLTDRMSLGFHWRDFPETPFLACATNIASLVVVGRKLQFFASFLPVRGVSGVGGRTYWALWNNEGWVFICLGLQFDKVYCTYRSWKKTLDQTWRCISDWLLAYRLKVPQAKTMHVTLIP